MKLKFVGALALLAAFAVPSESQAAVFAAHLQMVDNGNGTFNLNYRLNEPANQGVTVRVKGPSPLTTVVRTFNQGAQTTGSQTVVWDGKNDLAVAVPPGQYTWEVEASTNNTGATAYVKTIDGSNPIHTFFAPYGVDTNNDPTSPFFGTVYVTNNAGTVTATGRVTTDGVYILSADMEDITNQGNTAYGGGVAWGTTSSPFRCHVAPDGKVFVADWSDTNSGVWIMNPANPAAPFSDLFADGALRQVSGVTSNGMHGSISSIYVEGTGASRVMYTLDEDLTDPVGTSGQTGSVWKYPIGTVDSNYASSRTLEYNDAANGNPVINFSGKVVRDNKVGRGTLWISQNRASEVEANPCVFHYNGTAIDWKSAVDFPVELNNLAQGAIDVSADGNLLVAGGNAYMKVVDITDLNNEVLVYADTPPGGTKRDMAIDAAGNIFQSTSSSEEVIYYSKQGINAFTTPNPTGSAITVVGSSVNGWELY